MPTSVANSSVDLGALVVQIHDNNGPGCTPTAASVCVVNVSNRDELGNMTVDASQRVEYVGVATNVSYLTMLLLHRQSPLPEFNHSVKGSDVYLHQTAIRDVTATYDSVPQDRPYRDAAGIVLNDTDYGVYYYGPALAAPMDGNDNQTIAFTYGEGYGNPSFEQLGPYNTPCCSSTDTVTDFDGIVCDYVDASTCTTIQTATLRRRNARRRLRLPLGGRPSRHEPQQPL